MTLSLLILDVDNLAWRAFHSTGGLSHGGVQTGVVFGVLREVKRLVEKFETQDVVFCFDKGRSLRLKVDPNYKANRRRTCVANRDAAQGRSEVRRQLELLRDDYLPGMGWRNVVAAEGYEADDCIASVVHGTDRGAVIVSGDEDLYQLLRGFVSVYHPQKKLVVTRDSFVKEYGIDPYKWKQAKAVCGCPSDNVPGVRGVGEKRACQFIAGRASPRVKQLVAVWFQTERYSLNKRLVYLPFEGCPTFELHDQPPIPESKWKEVADRIGSRTLCAVNFKP